MMTEIQYLLDCLAEECNEVGIRCSKAIRFSVEEIQPGQPDDNRERINYEVNDVYAVMEMLAERGVDVTKVNRDMIAAKKAKVLKLMELSRERGMLEPEEPF